MIFKQPYMSRNVPVTSDSFIGVLVEDAVHSGGRAEATDHRLERLTEVVEYMFAQLSDAQQKDLAQYFGWVATDDQP